MLNGSNKQPAELRAAIEAGVTINIDDPSELDLVAGLAEQLGRPADVCLRVLPFSYADPATLEPELAAIAADTSHDKWGMDRQTIVALVPGRSSLAWLRLRGLHLHVSRLRADARGLRARGPPDRHVHRGAARPLRVAARAARLRRRLPARARSRERRCRPAATLVGTPEEYAEAVTSTLRAALAERSLDEPHLLLEPGRRLVSNATVLLTRVGVVKRLPTGTHDVGQRRREHEPLPARRAPGLLLRDRPRDERARGRRHGGQRRRPDLRDRPPRRAAAARARQGDLLAVLDVGGYAEVLSNQFNLLPRPATVLVDGDTLRGDPATRDARRHPGHAGVPAGSREIVDNPVMIDNRPGAVKITDVEAVVLRQPAVNEGIADGSQDDLVILVHTDEGITGIGEVDSAPEAVAALVRAPGSHAIAQSLRELLIGEDPLDVERLWDKMYRGVIFVGRRGIAIHAISGIDIALWDIKGKALGKPVCELLGTVKHDRIRAYASRLMPDTTEEVTEAVSALREQGFTAVKLGWGPLGQDPDHDVRLAAAAREAGGDGVEILIDAGLGYVADAATAIRVARELEQLGVYWLEEPFEPDEYEAYAELADAVDLTIAAGEQDATRWGFRELIERGHVDLIQPDVTRCGGITEMMRIAALAEEHGVALVPHAWKSGIIKAASLHVNAVLPGALFQEYCVAETEINTKLTHQLLPIEADGCVAVPTAPGLGIDLDEDVFSSLRVEAR